MDFNDFIVKIKEYGLGVASLNTYEQGGWLFVFILVASKGSRGYFFKQEARADSFPAALDLIIKDAEYFRENGLDRLSALNPAFAVGMEKTQKTDEISLFNPAMDLQIGFSDFIVKIKEYGLGVASLNTYEQDGQGFIFILVASKGNIGYFIKQESFIENFPTALAIIIKDAEYFRKNGLDRMRKTDPTFDEVLEQNKKKADDPRWFHLVRG